MYLGWRPPRAAELISGRAVLPRTIESSISTTRLPGRLAVSGLILQVDADLAQAVVRLDEGAADVAVLDQPFAVGMPETRA